MVSNNISELTEVLLSSKGASDEDSQQQYKSLLEEYVKEKGSSISSDDVFVAIGEKVFNISLSKDNGSTSSKPKVEEEKDPIIDFDYMKQFMKDVFLSYGVEDERAETCSNVLIEADKRGIDSHGLGRLKPIYCDRIDQGILYPSRPITIVKETATTALVDGDLGMGLYIGPHCMQMAIDKAKEYGVGFVCVQNSTHYGIAGYYNTMATENDCVGLTGTNARPSIAPTYGVEPMLGTNPLAFGIPSDDPFPFVIDCATSVNQRGKIERYQREGKPTPRGAVVDQNGIERTDTEGILRDMVKGTCSLTPLGGAGTDLGGYKGYGWATVVELLCIAFQSGPYGEAICGIDRATGKKKSMPLGHFFLAIHIPSICDIDVFKKNSSQLLQALRDSKKSPKGPGRIWTAGEPEHDARVERMAQGGMKVPKALQKDMKVLRDNRPGLKEKYSKLPFE